MYFYNKCYWMFSSKKIDILVDNRDYDNNNFCKQCYKDINDLDFLVCLNCPCKYHFECKRSIPLSKVRYSKSSVESKFTKCKNCNSLGTIFLKSQLDNTINLTDLLRL